MAFLQHSLTARLNVAYGGVVMVGMILIVLLTMVRLSSFLTNTSNDWGESAAEQLAQSTVDDVVAQDNIALHAQLGRLIKASGIVNAAIYDMQGTQLAQAGATLTEAHDHAALHRYTAMLTLGNNAIGHVEITLDTSALDKARSGVYRTAVAGGLLMLVAMLIISFYFGRQAFALHKKLSKQLTDAMPDTVMAAVTHNKNILDEQDFTLVLEALRAYITYLQQAAPVTSPKAQHGTHTQDAACIYILLECRNLTLLQRQLSRERLHSLLARFQQRIDSVCDAYGATRTNTTGAAEKITLTLSNDAQNSAIALQAADCAYVLAGVLRDSVDHGITLDWRMALDSHTANPHELLRNMQRTQDEQRSHWLCDQVDNGQIAFSTDAVKLLAQTPHLKLVDANSADGRTFYRLSSLSNEHRQALEQQIEKLLAAIKLPA